MNFESAQKRMSFGYYRNPNNGISVYIEQAAVVKMIFIYYDQGMGLGTIKEKLEKGRISSPHNGEKWSRQTISNILSNPHYLGDEVYPQIIPQELFDSVQKMKQSK